MYIQLAIILVLVIIDRLLKIYMTRILSGVTIKEFIPHFMHLTYVENTGASFGILKNYTLILSIITCIVIAFLLYFIVSKRSKSKLLSASLVLITAGGLGNLYDRLVYGYVVDYLEFSFVNYAVFNFADALVNIGAVMLFIYLIFFEKLLSSKQEDSLSVLSELEENDE